ncbi:hypothetical protein ACFPRL_21150 [Pseudoclavibacter helvolus]
MEARGRLARCRSSSRGSRRAVASCAHRARLRPHALARRSRTAGVRRRPGDP